ncbi:MAG: carbohydrate ABC transporter permease [Chloroflexota bacterium]|nr:MAG: carbohydrate ABC transporter permease [Chloroflexota bacterium]
MKSNSPTVRILVIAVLVLLSIAYLMPIYVMVITSLKSLEEVNRANYLVPSTNPQWSNYVEVLLGSPSFRSQMMPRLLNSTIISVSVTALAAFFGSLGGYYLSRSRTLIARLLFILIGIALYLPYQVVIIPLSILMSRTGMNQSYGGLIFSYLILNVPLASVLMGTFFLGIPRELEEAAHVDGASRVQTFFRIIAPISMPAYASVAIIIFTQVWNEFFLALTLATRNTQTVQVVMAEAKGTTLVLYNLQMAAALVAIALPMLLFLFLGRYFVRGILAGALKG